MLRYVHSVNLFWSIQYRTMPNPAPYMESPRKHCPTRVYAFSFALLDRLNDTGKLQPNSTTTKSPFLALSGTIPTRLPTVTIRRNDILTTVS